MQQIGTDIKLFRFEATQSRFLMNKYNLRRAPALLCYYGGKLTAAEPLSLPKGIKAQKPKLLVVQTQPEYL